MRRLLQPLFATVLAVSPLLAVAAGSAVRGPSNVAADDSEVANAASGLIELNAARERVSTVHGYDSVTSISVDADRGVIKGYAEFELPGSGTFNTADTIGSSVFGSVSSPVTFSGATAPFTVTAELRFDGSFTALDGLPTLSLAGNITASTFTAIPFTQSIYQSQLAFIMSKATATYEPVAVLTSLATEDIGGVETVDPAYAGATQVVVSDAASSLEGIVRLSIEVDPAQSYIFSSNLLGLVTAEPGSFSSGSSAELLASAGVVDFSHTGEFTLYVPQGITVSGDSLMQNVVVTAVPEPASYALMLAGLLTVGIARYRRRGRGFSR